MTPPLIERRGKYKQLHSKSKSTCGSSHDRFSHIHTDAACKETVGPLNIKKSSDDKNKLLFFFSLLHIK